MRFLLDAWLLVQMLRGNAEANEWFQHAAANVANQLFIPTICLVELVRVGLRAGKSRKEITSFLDSLYYAADIAPNVQMHGLNRWVVEEAGRIGHNHPLGIADCVLLALAKRLGAAIKTDSRDVKTAARQLGIRTV